jgi:hypothetical protein
MTRLLALAGLIVVGCHAPPHAARVTDSGSPASGAQPSTPSAALFSRPIAAAVGTHGLTFVAGLVVARSAVVLTAIGPDGAALATSDVVSDVAWSPNATLTVLRAADGALVVWRGQRHGLPATVAVLVDAAAKVLGEPFPVGAAVCTTDVDLAWISERGGGWAIETRGFAPSTPVVAMTLTEDREPALYCGARRLFAFGDGEQDVTLTTWSGGVRSPTARVIEDAAFRGDDERVHELYGVGDTVGVVRVGTGGTVSTREVTVDRRSPWRRFGRKLAATDDVTVVDADAHTALLAFTREAAGANDLADVSGASSILAFAWQRDGDRETTFELAPADTSRARGPFWSGAVTGGVAVAWVERGARRDAAGAAPIVGLTFTVVSLDGASPAKTLTTDADELVDAGCDDRLCAAVALVRRPGEDGGQPETIAVLRYP